MRWLAKLRMLLRSIFERRQLDTDLDEELREHMERETEDNLRAGMSAEQARSAARRTVGALSQIKDECRDARAAGFIQIFARDLQYSLRMLRRSPLSTLIALITLSIGIGATSAIFSVVNGVLLKPLPYPDAAELITVNHAAPGVDLPEAGTAPFLHFTYRDQARSFQDIGLYRWARNTVTGLHQPEDALSLNVSAQVLPILGIQSALGRRFSDKDDAPGSPPAMVLSYAWWQARFGGDRTVLGRAVTVDGVPYEVIGVLPSNFTFLDQNAAFLLPLQLDRSKTILGDVSYEGIARLRPGVTIGQAAADLARLIPIALHSYPPLPGFTVKAFEDVRLAPRLESLKNHLVGDLSKTLWVLMGTIGIVLLIACANVANLLLVRVEGRQHELAIRAALGAGRRDIARQLLMESIVLGLFGGMLGLAIADAAIRLLIAIAPAHLPRLNEISIDPAVLAFTVLTALSSGVLFGIIPVFKYAGPRIATALRGGGRTSSQTRERRLTRGMLVVVQVALAVVLLVGSGLMIRTFQALRHVDPGFDPHDALTMRIAIPEAQVKDPVAVAQLEQSIHDKIRAIPGVVSAGMTAFIPTDPGGSLYQVYARDKTYDKVPPLRRQKFISPGLLAALGSRLVAGREFTWADVYGRRSVAMVSENLARELWGDPRAAIGKEITPNQKDPWREVIGVIADERSDGMQQPAPASAYYPLLMYHFNNEPVAALRTVAYIVRSRRAGSAGLLADVQRAVWSVNPSLPLAEVRTLDEIYSKSMERTSFTLVMLTIAGAMALLIGLVGIYGAISYAVSHRRREIGIRMALGAPPRRLSRIFVADGLALALTGVVCGLAASAALTRILGSSLFGVSPLDPLTYASVTIVLIAAAVAASYIPALRATKVDPLEALRPE
ncbi:MAG: ABC transporter permease [Bryobacteraceae bacterium]